MDQKHIDFQRQANIDAELEIEELSLDEFRLLSGLVMTDLVTD